jgi:hypothetical protein
MTADRSKVVREGCSARDLDQVRVLHLLHDGGLLQEIRQLHGVLLHNTTTRYSSTSPNNTTRSPAAKRDGFSVWERRIENE